MPEEIHMIVTCFGPTLDIWVGHEVEHSSADGV